MSSRSKGVMKVRSSRSSAVCASSSAACSSSRIFWSGPEISGKLRVSACKFSADWTACLASPSNRSKKTVSLGSRLNIAHSPDMIADGVIAPPGRAGSRSRGDTVAIFKIALSRRPVRVSFFTRLHHPELHAEGGPFPRRGLHLDRSTVRLDDVLDDRQPQPRPAHLARARPLGPVKPLENPRQILSADADPVVDHLDD